MALYTLEEFASYVQADVDTATSTLLRDLVTGAIQSAVGQVLNDVTDTIKISPTDSNEILLPQLPASQPTEVKVGGVVVTDWTFSTDRLIRRAGWIAYDSQGGFLPVEVTYQHGYTTYPSDLKRIALQAAARAYTNPTGAQQSSTTETTGSESHTVSQSFSSNVRTLSVELTKKEKTEARRAVGLGGAFTIDVVSAYERPWFS